MQFLLLFLVITLALGLFHYGLLVKEKMDNFNKYILNHTCSYYCNYYDYGNGFLECEAEHCLNEHGTAFNYARSSLNYSPDRVVSYVVPPVGVCIVIAGIVLAIVKPRKERKPKTSAKQDDVPDFVNNVLD